MSKHNDVAEADYHSYHPDIFQPEPPFRVCLRCGFAESGWGCGYQILKKVDKKLARTSAHKFIEGPIHCNGKFVRVGDIFDKNKLYEMAVRNENES